MGRVVIRVTGPSKLFLDVKQGADGRGGEEGGKEPLYLSVQNLETSNQAGEQFSTAFIPNRDLSLGSFTSADGPVEFLDTHSRAEIL